MDAPIAAMPSVMTEKDLRSSTMLDTLHSSQPLPLQVQSGFGTMAALMISPRKRVSLGVRAWDAFKISSVGGSLGSFSPVRFLDPGPQGHLLVRPGLLPSGP